MMTSRVAPWTFAAIFLVVSTPLFGQTTSPAKLMVDSGTIVTPVSPMLYGLMTEEINHSYDGGLYAEMVENRTFRGRWDGVGNWSVVRNGNARASFAVDRTDGPSKALPTSLKLTVEAASPGNAAGVSNNGYWGMAVQPRTKYSGSFYARTGNTSPGPVTAALISNDTGKVLALATVALRPGAWSRYEYTLTIGADVKPSAANHLQLTVAQPGSVSLQLVSLFPPTYKGRANGNRADLMTMMAGMHPKFLRLPGGNYLEGDLIADRYDFKKTIGPLVDRAGHQAPWTYWSTDGLGLLEFLNWCEDLNIEPVLAVYAGYALKGAHINPGADLAPYVQDALDEVEYVTGGPDTKWGAQRIKDGHPAPFPLHYIEIGNEDWFDKSGSYPGRFEQFALALRKKYPQYKLIITAPVKINDKGAQPDVVDDHYYKSPAEMFDLVHHYDDAPRNGPKVFVGEWATRSGSPTPNFGDALGDAAWMTSMERNSDLILISSYAPMLVNVSPGAMQWATDLIGFDALGSYASPSYYAQALFAGHVGDGTAKSTIEGAGERFFYSATVSSMTKTLHLKLVNASDIAQPLTLDLRGVAGAAKMTTLHAASYQATNSITAPNAIKPVESNVRLTSAHTVPAYTIEVIDVPLK
jgi:alpha-N-arabinofuranosidase